MLKISKLNSQNRNANPFRQNLWLENSSTSQKVTRDLVGFTKTFAVSHLPPCMFAFRFSCSFAFSLVTLQNSYFILCYPTSIFSYVDLFYLFSVSLNNFHSFESKASSMSKSAAAFLLARPAACSWWLASTSNRRSIHVVPHKKSPLVFAFPCKTKEKPTNKFFMTCLSPVLLKEVIHSQGRIAWIQSHFQGSQRSNLAHRYMFEIFFCFCSNFCTMASFR